MSDHLIPDDRLDDRIYNFVGDYGAHVIFCGLWVFWTVVTVLVSPAPTSTMEWVGMLFVGLIMALITTVPMAFIVGLIVNVAFTIYWAIRDGIDEVRYRQGL